MSIVAAYEYHNILQILAAENDSGKIELNNFLHLNAGRRYSRNG